MAFRSALSTSCRCWCSPVASASTARFASTSSEASLKTVLSKTHQSRAIRTSSITRQELPPSPTPGSKPPASESADRGKLYNERQAAGGPFTWKSAAVFVVTGTGLYLYFQNEKRKIEERKKQESAAQKVGRPKIGGPFTLTTQYGTEFTDQDLLGKHSLVYFGFTNCPDICPEELDKMSSVVDKLSAVHGPDAILPVFITCDPARDSVAAINTYCKDFHPKLIGLTGTYQDIKKVCKTYRVYFSTPPDAKATDDYLVDHSIFFYLMDPEGKFVEAFGRSATEADVVSKVDGFMKDFKAGVRKSDD